MKFYQIFLTLLISGVTFSQEKINTLNYDNSKVKASLFIADNENKKVVIVNQFKTLTDYLFLDENMNLISKISDENLEEKKEYIGNSFKNGKYYTYWYKDDIITVKELDFSQNSFKKYEIGFTPEKKDKEIAAISQREKLYLIYVNKETNFLNIYSLEENQLKKNAIDVSQMKFVDSNKSVIDFYDICSEENGLFFTNGFNLEPKNNYSSLVHSGQKKKVFIEDNHIVLAFDNNNSFTQTLFVNLNDFSKVQKIFKKQHVNLSNPTAYIDSNSYLTNNYLFQIKSTYDDLYLSVRDSNGNEIKNIAYKTDNFGTTYNSALIEEEGSFIKRDTLKKPNQFIHRVYGKKTSINVKLIDDKYYIYFGGVSYPKQNSGILIGGAIGGAIGGIVGALIAGSPDNLAINGYANRNVVHTKLILDKNFNHITDKAENSKLESLRSFIETEKKTKFYSVFSLTDNLFLTSYDDNKKEIAFYKF